MEQSSGMPMFDSEDIVPSLKAFAALKEDPMSCLTEEKLEAVKFFEFEKLNNSNKMNKTALE